MYHLLRTRHALDLYKPANKVDLIVIAYRVVAAARHTASRITMPTISSLQSIGIILANRGIIVVWPFGGISAATIIFTFIIIAALV